MGLDLARDISNSLSFWIRMGELWCPPDSWSLVFDAEVLTLHLFPFHFVLLCTPVLPHVYSSACAGSQRNFRVGNIPWVPRSTFLGWAGWTFWQVAVYVLFNFLV